MKENNVFNSTTKPIPGIRRDIEIIPVQENGDSYIYFHDQLGYATPNFALDSKATMLLNLLDGTKSIDQLSPHLGKEVTNSQVLEYVSFLDKHRLLQSNYFKDYARQVELKYEASHIHRSVTAGHSYPANPSELTAFLNDAFAKADDKNISPQKPIKALYAPHIDPRVGMQSYVKAFSSIRHIKPKRVIILATSHYSGLYPETYSNTPFIISDKNIEMPLGTIKTDKNAVEYFMENAANTGLTNKDRAHRIEHSIELHLLFLSYLWKHSYTIVPILVGGLQELMYFEEGQQATQVQAFGRQIREQFVDDPDTFFLISGDLAHIGKKFGDQQPARELFDEVENFDEQFLSFAEKGLPENILQLIKEDLDPYRICGYPPLYSFLKAMPELKGKVLSYERWDEQERQSAVTFGSIIFTMKN